MSYKLKWKGVTVDIDVRVGNFNNSVHNSYPTCISCSSARQTRNRLHLMSFSNSCFGFFPTSPHPPPPPKKSELMVYHWILKYLKTIFLQPSWQASKRVEGREGGSQGGVSLSLLFSLSSLEHAKDNLKVFRNNTKSQDHENSTRLFTLSAHAYTNCHCLFKIFPRFWLAQIPRLIRGHSPQPHPITVNYRFSNLGH